MNSSVQRTFINPVKIPHISEYFAQTEEYLELVNRD